MLICIVDLFVVLFGCRVVCLLINVGLLAVYCLSLVVL